MAHYARLRPLKMAAWSLLQAGKHFLIDRTLEFGNERSSARSTTAPAALGRGTGVLRLGALALLALFTGPLAVPNRACDLLVAYSLKLKLVLEAFPYDSTFAGPQAVVEECSAALANKERMDPALLARVYERRGDALGELYRWDEAYRDYEQLAQLRLHEPEPAYKKASALFFAGKRAEALTQLRALIEAHPDYAEAHALIAGCHFYLFTTKESMSEARECLESAERATALDKDLWLPYHVRALVFERLHDYDKCLEESDKCLTLDANIGPVHLENLYLVRGSAFIGLSKPTEALANFLMAERLHPSSVRARLGLWAVYFSTGRYQMADRISEELSKLDTTAPDPLTARAASLVALGRVDEALTVAQRALQRQPTNASAQWRLGTVHFALGQYDKALGQYQEVLKNAPDCDFVRASKAYLLASCPDVKYRDGKRARAIAGDLCAEAAQNKPGYLMILAMAQAECGAFDEAVRLAKKALDVAGHQSHLREQYEKRLKLFEQKQPFRWSPDAKAFDYLLF